MQFLMFFYELLGSQDSLETTSTLAEPQEMHSFCICPLIIKNNKRFLFQKSNLQQLKDDIKEKLPENLKAVPPPTVPSLAAPGGETLKRSKKNRPAPQPPRPSDLEIRAPSELLVGIPGALKTQWKHQPFVLVTGAVTYVANVSIFIFFIPFIAYGSPGPCYCTCPSLNTVLVCLFFNRLRKKRRD